MLLARQISVVLVAVVFVLAGANHFRSPTFYLSMMPPWLPQPRALVWLSGVCEVLGGIGVLVPDTRSFATWGLVALLVAVLPANVQVALHPDPAAQGDYPAWARWIRLPLQAVLIGWVGWTGAVFE